jgi:hypothetical protein
MQATLGRSLPVVAFTGAVGAVLVSFALLVRSATFAANPDLLSLAITADLLLTVPLAYLLMAWRFGFSLRPLVPLFVAMLLLGTLILPAESRRTLDAIRSVALPALELLVLGYLAYAIHDARKRFRSATSFDAVLRMRTAALRIAGNRALAAILASELSIFYYAFRPFRAEREAPADGRSFSSHRESAAIAILATLTLVVVVETVAVHLLVSMWQPVVAWVLTALGVYSLFFVVAHARALALRPHVVSGAQLFVRNGLLHSADVPLAEIEEVRTPLPKDRGPGRILNAAAPAAPNVAVTLRRDREAVGMYGTRKRFRCVLLHVDEPASFEELLGEYGRGSNSGTLGGS